MNLKKSLLIGCFLICFCCYSSYASIYGQTNLDSPLLLSYCSDNYSITSSYLNNFKAKNTLESNVFNYLSTKPDSLDLDKKTLLDSNPPETKLFQTADHNPAFEDEDLISFKQDKTIQRNTTNPRKLLFTEINRSIVLFDNEDIESQGFDVINAYLAERRPENDMEPISITEPEVSERVKRLKTVYFLNSIGNMKTEKP
jgi:hypothetical protein